MKNVKPKKVLGIVVITLIVGIGIGYTLNQQQKQALEQQAINSFEACATAGNPVMESYPPKCMTKDGRSFTQDIGNEQELNEKIKITAPRPLQAIKTPLVIQGEARGTWFFEAQAVAKLLDEQNVVLATKPITAQGEWMTENFVPFTGELEFQKPSTKKGTLILEKANPSGLSENDEKLIIPIFFE